MSFDSLCDTQPPVFVFRSQQPTATTAGGLAAPDSPQPALVIRGRLVLASASQVAFWMTLGIAANYELLTRSSAIQNGDTLQVTTPDLGVRIFRVEGTRGRRMGEGTGIGSFFKYAVKEVTK